MTARFPLAAAALALALTAGPHALDRDAATRNWWSRAAAQPSDDDVKKALALGEALKTHLFTENEYLEKLMEISRRDPDAVAAALKPGDRQLAQRCEALAQALQSGVLSPDEYRAKLQELVRRQFGGDAAPPADAAAAGADSFQNFTAENGAHIAIGSLGAQATLAAAVGATLRGIRASFGSRPSLTELAVNAQAQSATLFFEVTTAQGAPYGGMAMVDAASGGPSSAVIIFDDRGRFPATIDRALQQARELLDPTNKGGGVSEPISPPEPMSARGFSDGTGQFSLPADWTILNASGGAALARGPTGEIVAYNSDAMGWDPNSQQGAVYLNSLPATIRASTLARYAVMPYPDDPVRAWQTVLPQLAKQRNAPRLPSFTVSEATRTPIGATQLAEIVGEAYLPGIQGNAGDEIGAYVAYVQTTPPDRIGQWNMYYSWVFVPKSQMPRYGETAMAAFASVRINNAALQQQFEAIRESFQRKFEAMIDNAEQQRRLMVANAENARLQDAAAQERMHKQTVAVCNTLLDRQTILDKATGEHSTVDAWFAEHLVRADPNFERVPAQELLRGVDY